MHMVGAVGLFCEIAAVNKPQLYHIYRNFRVIALLQLLPDLILQRSTLRSRLSLNLGLGNLLPQRIGIAPLYTKQLALRLPPGGRCKKRALALGPRSTVAFAASAHAPLPALRARRSLLAQAGISASTSANSCCLLQAPPRAERLCP